MVCQSDFFAPKFAELKQAVQDTCNMQEFGNLGDKKIIVMSILLRVYKENLKQKP